jgi:hypothetical protein
MALLATNRKGTSIRHSRRLRYVVDTPCPTSRIGPHLAAIMMALAGPERARELRADLERVASAVEMTGAQIKFSVLSAMFTARRDARPVALGDLVGGLERELAKEGRPLGDRVRERLGHAT